MAKICTCGCNGPVFSKGLCMNAWRREYGKPINKGKGLEVSRKPIKQNSEKQSDINRSLSELKRSIELDAIQNDSYYCQGCGISHPGLDKSHILPIKDYKHLELVRENIQLLCRKCHMFHESNVYFYMSKLNCFQETMSYIKQHDESLYSRIMSQNISI